MKEQLQLRGIQLDLARQMETLDFIKGFIDFAAANHYNMLFLYLEWRIRTKTVDLGEKEGYSHEELRQIIDYAGKQGMTVIPGLATFGHADLLFKQEKYQHLSELYGNIQGRFEGTQGQAIDFCASNNEVKELLKKYIEEVCEIFADSPYIHIGADEVHHIGYCEVCREKAKSYSDEAKLFLNHLLYVCSTVKSCGKKVMMWDDMFEFYEEILPAIPKDALLVSWLYHDNVYSYKGHFFNQTFKDMFAIYEKEGLEYLIAPADYSGSNITSFTKLAEKYHPKGGLLTSWEKAGTLMYKTYANIAIAGTLWNGGISTEEGIRKAIKGIFPACDELFINAIRENSAKTGAFAWFNAGSSTVFDFNGPDETLLPMLESCRNIFRKYNQEKAVSPLEKTVLQDLLFDCELKILKQRSILAAWNHIHSQEGEDFARIREDLEKEEKEYQDFYRIHRPQDGPEKTAFFFDSWRKNLDRSERLPGSYLQLIVMLPDYFSAPHLSIFVNDMKIASSTYKCFWKHLFYVYLPLPEDVEKIQSVRLEVTGFGAAGLCYVSGKCANGTIYVPDVVVALNGWVVNGEYIAKKDISFALCGIPDVERCYVDRSAAKMVSSLTIRMKEEGGNSPYAAPSVTAEKEISYVWKDVLEAPFELEGSPWIRENKDPYFRSPERLVNTLTQRIISLSHHTTGYCIRFRSDSPVIRLSATLAHSLDMNHMPRCGSAGFDSYSKGEGDKEYIYRNTMQVSPRQTLLAGIAGRNEDGGMKEWIINLPLYGGVSKIEIGVEESSTLLPPLPRKITKPILFYGSSITQGACASRPGNQYSSWLCRKVDAPQFNYGFSGEAHGDLFMADILAEADGCCLIYDYDYNAFDPEKLAATHEPFFKHFRSKCPDIPVIILSRCSKGSHSNEERTLRNAIIEKTYQNAVAAGDKNVYYINGRTLFAGEGEDGCTVDGCHPTDLGFFRMYQTILPVLKKALKLD